MKVRICVAAEKIPDFISWRIMRFLKFAASHIFIVYKDRMYHAIEEGITDHDFLEFCKDHHIVAKKEVEFFCTEEEFFAWYAKIKGTPYSQSQYVGFFFPFLKRFVRNKRKAAICSEFVAWAMEDLARRSDFGDSDFLNPKEVFDRI